MPSKLTFVIGPADESSSINLLSKALEDIRRLLRDVDYAIYGSKSKAEWMVESLKATAPTIALAPGRDDTRAVAAIAIGIRMVTDGTNQPPPHFTEPVLEDLKRMRRLFLGRGKARYVSVLMDDEETATIREDIAIQTDRILSAGHHNLGSIQGRLEAINVHNSSTATIWDRVSGAPVRWAFPHDWMGKVKELLERLVLVTGDVRYFANGAPRSISKVVSIEDATPVQRSERAEFGSIPDKRVQEIGAAEWLKSVRGLGQQ